MLPRPCLHVAFISGVVSEMRDFGAGQCLKCSAVSLHTGGYLQLACLAWPVSMTTHPRDHNHD